MTVLFFLIIVVGVSVIVGWNLGYREGWRDCEKQSRIIKIGKALDEVVGREKSDG